VSSEEILDKLEGLLEQERRAIRGLDGAGVARAAEEKEALVRALCTQGDLDGAGLELRLRALTSGLRRNGVLLAHARDCLRDVLVASGAVAAGGGIARPRLSLRG
jgi:hypothetical protein